MQINLSLHDKQMEVMQSKAKRVVVPTGRRAGKSYLARKWIQRKLLGGRFVNGFDLIDSPILYVAPSEKKAIKYMWRPMIRELKEMRLLTDKGIRRKMLELELVNGRQLWLASADNPDSLRGDSLADLVVDETKDVKREAIEEAVMPALLDKNGDALFIGSPKKGTYFQELYERGISDEVKYKHWESFTFTTYDNPAVPRESIDLLKLDTPDWVFRQEVLGQFVSSEATALEPENFQIIKPEQVPQNLPIYIAVDLCGYGESKSKKDDETVIAIVAAGQLGWYILDIQHGRWGPRETVIKILKAYQRYQPDRLGIEKGSLKNALNDYFSDHMRKLKIFPRIEGLSHGGQKKQQRIIYSLQGRLEQRRLYMVEAPWNKYVLRQVYDFPSPFAHDDALDAISYIGQLAITIYSSFSDLDGEDEWEPEDEVSGF